MIAPKLLPVHIADVPAPPLPTSRSTATTAVPTIHIEVTGKARISIEGYDQRCLRTVLECLLR